MTAMSRNLNLRKRWFNILLILLLALFIIFANISAQIPKPTPSTLTLHATIYLPTATLQPILQSKVDQQGPSGLLGSLIHPSVTNLTPQSNGLAMTLSENLFPGGPPPLEATMLLTFNVLNSSTIQVSGEPMPGSLLSLSGPLTQIKIPQGQLNSIAPTPNCGDSALAVKMGVPISTSNQGQKSSPLAIPRLPMQAANAYVEVTSSSLSSLGKDLGSLAVSQQLTAQNFRISIEHNEILAQSDISLWQTGIIVGSSTTHIQPLVENGNLVLHVKRNDFSTLLFAFPFDSYDQQIEQKLNDLLASSIAGLFTVTQAAIGTNAHIPCEASDSMILTGTTSLLS
jgi:hypothetical protein